MYSVKEIFYTLQGEGAQAGRAAVFCRFAGCNLWSGREADRASAICKFCDTDFTDTNGPGGGKFASAEALAAAVEAHWAATGGSGSQVSESRPGVPNAVQTETGEAGPSTPLRSAQDDSVEGERAKSRSFDSALDNSVMRLRKFVVCTGGEPLLQLDLPLIEALHARGFEIAVETNGTQAAPAGLDWICVSPKAGTGLVQRSGSELKLVYPQADVDPASFESLDFRHFFLQPMDGPEREANTQAAVRYCLEHPKWRLSLQTHKLLGIP